MITQETDLLTRDELLGILKLSRSKLYKLMELHGFPKPIRIGGASNRWLRSEVEVWLRAQIQVREEHPTIR